MKNKEIVISLFEKDVGKLKGEKIQGYFGDKIIHTFIFYNEEKSIEILLFFHQDRSNPTWTVYHELSKENPQLSKQICMVCNEVQYHTQDGSESYEMSEELSLIHKQSFLKTAIKSHLQNFVTKHMVIYKTSKNDKR